MHLFFKSNRIRLNRFVLGTGQRSGFDVAAGTFLNEKLNRRSGIRTFLDFIQNNQRFAGDN